jgi:hypothetical protein
MDISIAELTALLPIVRRGILGTLTLYIAFIADVSANDL